MSSDLSPQLRQDFRIQSKVLGAYARDAGLCCHLLRQQLYVAPVRFGRFMISVEPDYN